MTGCGRILPRLPRFLHLKTALSSSSTRAICSPLRLSPLSSGFQRQRRRRMLSQMLKDPFEYNWVHGAEYIQRYEPGGYHPVMIGDVLHERYRIVDKLGYGGYSTIWLAWDSDTGQFVAVKVGVAGSLPNETRVLRALARPRSEPLDPVIQKARDSIPIPLDEFEVKGMNGTHPCYVMKPARSDLRTISFSRLFPIGAARSLSAGVAVAVGYLHSQGFAHGDLHLGNILVQLPPAQLRTLTVESFHEKYGQPEIVPVVRRDGAALPPNVPPEVVVPVSLGKDAEDFTLEDCIILLGDFGEAFEPATDQRRGEDCRTMGHARPPEALLNPKSALQLSADIWSLAVTIWEILGMKALFSKEFVDDDNLISQHIDILGPLPEEDWQRWESRAAYFTEDGRPITGRHVWAPLEEEFEHRIQKYRREDKMVEFGPEESQAILELMRQMLRFEPEKRISIHDVLKSEWMVKWALPELQRSG